MSLENRAEVIQENKYNSVNVITPIFVFQPNISVLLVKSIDKDSMATNPLKQV